MRPCYLFITLALLSFSRSLAQVTASFTVPSSVCAGTPVTVHNTSVGASSYFWSFCAADFSANPDPLNLGNPNNVLNVPVFGCYTQDADGNYYGLVTCHIEGHLIRLRFGNSLLNTPTGEDLGGFGGIIPSQAEGIQLLKVNGNWTAIIVGGGNTLPNSAPRVVKVDFGSALTNPGTATNWGNVGGLNLPHKLYIAPEGGHYIGFTINALDNTLTRFDFGTDFTNPPTGVNMGTIGGMDYPDGMTFTKYNGNWYCMVANGAGNSTLTRLNFGTSLLNTPTGVNIGNPGNTLNLPRDVALFTTCSGVYGFVTNYTNNNIVKLYFGSDPTSVPQATDLGNIGNFNFPHSLSDFFRVGNDIYTFVPNASGNTLTRIRFAGCSDIPGSPAQNPTPITYTKPGVYNINLLVDLGLPTQNSFCQEITVNALPEGGLAGDTVCEGSTPVLAYAAVAGSAPFTINYTDGTNKYTQSGLPSQSSFPLPVALTSPGSASYTLQHIKDANGCSTDTTLTTVAMIDPLPQGGIWGKTSCGSDSATLVFTSSSGLAPFTLQLTGGSPTVTPGQAFNLLLSGSPTTYTLTSITDKNGCSRTTGFDTPSVSIMPMPVPVLQFTPLSPVCINAGPQTITAASETSGLPGNGVYTGPGITPDGYFLPAIAGEGAHKILYTYTGNDGCVASDSSMLQINPAPIQGAELITGCEGIPVHLFAVKGAATYDWTPTNGLNNPAIADPVANIDATITYIAQVVDSNGCAAADTVTIKDAGTVKTAFMIPNAFTPNGDGHNDCFGIRAWGQVTLDEFDIFDRWGARVFSTKNPGDCWDGTYNGQLEPPGAYIFVIKAETACGKITRTGSLMLMR